MNIRELARFAGVSTQQIRNYEAFGLFPPVPRSANGYRVFAERHLEALRTTRAMTTAGYSQAQALEVMQAVHAGEIETALALVDAHHARLDRQRRQVELTLAAIRTLQAGPAPHPGSRRPQGLTIGEAAKVVGVQPSALRFWEAEGLLRPMRDPHSGYRRFDRTEMKRLEVVVLLRRANYRFDAIRSVLDELSLGRPESSLRAVEQRRGEIAAASQACARATAALVAYLQEVP